MAGGMVFRPRLIDKGRIRVLLELFLISHICLAYIHNQSLGISHVTTSPVIHAHTCNEGRASG